MKVIFAGPSLHGTKQAPATELSMRPPARQGDIHKAVQDGARAIGLIDGLYENVPAVWHKEILFALSEGVRVWGAASIGALRAAECAPFGMVGIGQIFRAYAAGDLVDDADVALLHAPQELGYLPLSEPMVNVLATIDRHRARGLLSPDEQQALLAAARAIFFKHRSWKAIVAAARLPDGRACDLLRELVEHRVNQKLADAELLLECVREAPDALAAKPTGWRFARTAQFSRFMA